jgi:aspartyl-tRNA(Asn)/glutamyl-tRNA(Gln) amidotransferase subunit C
MGKITKEDVLYLARLSKISVNDDEVEKLRKELDDILGFIDELQSEDTDNIQPTYQVNSITNTLADLRSDEIETQIDKKELLKNAPELDGDYIKVPKVL